MRHFSTCNPSFSVKNKHFKTVLTHLLILFYKTCCQVIPPLGSRDPSRVPHLDLPLTVCKKTTCPSIPQTPLQAFPHRIASLLRLALPPRPVKRCAPAALPPCEVQSSRRRGRPLRPSAEPYVRRYRIRLFAKLYGILYPVNIHLDLWPSHRVLLKHHVELFKVHTRTLTSPIEPFE